MKGEDWGERQDRIFDLIRNKHLTKYEFKVLETHMAFNNKEKVDKILKTQEIAYKI